MLRLLNTGRVSGQLTNNLLKTTCQIRSVHDLTINPKTGKVAVRHGAGGRSSTNELVATVFGCTGFIGRYVVNKIARRGTQVVTPYRGLPDNNRHLKLMGDLGQIVPLEFDLRNYDQVVECVRHSDVVVNLIGRYQETRNFTFDDTHNVGARTVARACRETGVHRLIHVSALNAFEDSPSGFLASKARGEKAVLEEFPEATIVRPGTMYGYEDYFLNRIGHTKHIHWMVNGGQQTLYPVNGLDVALAIELLTRDDSTAGKTYELYGPKKYSYKEIVDMCGEIIKESINVINVPAPVLKTLSTALQVYPYRILRPDEVTRLTINDQPTKNALKFEDLGISPQYLENTILAYLRGYRTAQFYELGYDDELSQKKAKF